MNIQVNSGVLDFSQVTPIDPTIYICEICNKNPSNGSVGKLNDPLYIQWVCEDCYKNVLKMKPLVDFILNKD